LQSDAIIQKRGDENHFISSIHWSNDGDRLLTSAYDNIARVFSLQGKIQGMFKTDNSIFCSSWNKSDTLVATGGDETNVHIWNPTT
jgi:WD40 repeat protein